MYGSAGREKGRVPRTVYQLSAIGAPTKSNWLSQAFPELAQPQTTWGYAVPMPSTGRAQPQMTLAAPRASTL
jgi:hypothetical protein